MSLVRHRVDMYDEIVELMSSYNVVGESNHDMMVAAIDDVNTLIAVCNGNADETAVDTSSTVEYLLDNASANGERIESLNIEDIYYIAGLFAYELIVAIMHYDNFYLTQIDKDTALLVPSYSGATASLRLNINQYWTLDDVPISDLSVMSTRFITGFFKLFPCGGKRAKELRIAIRGAISAYKA